jgi:hypothetical protein
MHANLLFFAGWFVTLTIASNGGSVIAQDDWPPRVEAALELAGDNRIELEKLLAVYQENEDDLKFQASCFLIENMPGHSYVEAGLLDKNGTEIPFDVLQYKSLGEAKQAQAELEAIHGPLKVGRTNVVKDIEHVTADFLAENIESAFRTWRTKPWAKKMSFEAFCEYILPYRATNEPVESWRDECELDTKSVVAEMKDTSSWREAAGAISKLNKHRVYFNQLYYLHPTDQGFSQLCEKPIGRCEDQQTMQVYVMRANGIAVAGDYTPYWANRDNNHAWEVMLDEQGQGHGGLFNRAAKIYRKTYSHNLENLVFKNEGAEKLPKWLAGRTFRDVTNQYMPTTDVSIELTETSPQETQFAFICVFNGGEWKPIHWSSIENHQAQFTGMGRNIAYMVGYYVDNKMVPAAPPFILNEDGKTSQLTADFNRLDKWRLSKTAPAIKDDDLKTELAEEKTTAGTSYEIMVWQMEWKSLGQHIVDPKETTVLGRLPAGGLYWMVSDTNRQTARPFTIENGKPRFW